MRTLILTLLFVATMLPSWADFSGPYELQNFTQAGFTTGSTTLTPSSGSSATAEFSYSVVADSGVSDSGSFTGIAASSGTISFDYDYSGFHAFFQSSADFRILVNGFAVLTPVDSASTSGNFTFTGSHSFPVNAGDRFSFRVGGRHNDSNGNLNGTLTLSNFSGPPPLVLDSTNNYSVTIAPGLTISQPDYLSGRGTVLITGGTAALGTSDVADFDGATFTTIGGQSANPGGNSNATFVNNAIPYTLRDDATGTLYEVVHTFYRASNLSGTNAGGVGTPPSPDNTAGLAMQVSLAPLVPNFVLDNTNNYSATIAPGLTISQPLFNSNRGRVEFTGGTAAFGTSDVADFDGATFTSIGGGSSNNPGGNSNAAFVNNAIPYTLRDDATGALYHVVHTFFRSPDSNGDHAGGVGTFPSPDNNAGLALSVVSIPQVTNTDDSGPGSLRQVLADSPDNSLITFDPTVFNSEPNKTITLASPLDHATKTIVIDASFVSGVTLDANGSGRIFTNTSGGTLTLDSLNLTGASGIAVDNTATLTVQNCALYENTNEHAIRSFNSGDLTITNSTIALNAGTFGTALLSRGNSATLTHVTIANNVGSIGTAGIVHENGTLTLDGCLLSNPGNGNTFGNDLGGAGATVVAATPNFIRALDPANAYTASFTTGPTIGTLAAPVEPLLYGDNLTGAQIPITNLGGPTHSLIPQPGSPAINNSATTTGNDQRGVPPLGNRDLGAIETRWNNNTSATASATIIADVTTPTTPIAIYPSDLNLRVGTLPELLDGNNSVVVFDSSANAGITLSPAMPDFNVHGLTLTSYDDTGAGTGMPSSFLLLGSNDLNSFQPLVSGELPPVSSSNEEVSLYFPSSLPHFSHYRLHFPSSTDPTTTFESIGEIELLGTPPLPRPLAITDCTTVIDSGNGINWTLTFDSTPGTTYAVYRSTSLSNLGAGLSSPFAHTQVTADSWTTTTPSFGAFLSSIPSNFYRIQEVPLN